MCIGFGQAIAAVIERVLRGAPRSGARRPRIRRSCIRIPQTARTADEGTWSGREAAPRAEPSVGGREEVLVDVVLDLAAEFRRLRVRIAEVDSGPDPRFEDLVRHIREPGEEALLSRQRRVGRETAARGRSKGMPISSVPKNDANAFMLALAYAGCA